MRGAIRLIRSSLSLCAGVSNAVRSRGGWQTQTCTPSGRCGAGVGISAARGEGPAGTDGRGLYRLSPDGSQFRPLRLQLPSQRITAIGERGQIDFIFDIPPAIWSGAKDPLPDLPVPRGENRERLWLGAEYRHGNIASRLTPNVLDAGTDRRPIPLARSCLA